MTGKDVFQGGYRLNVGMVIVNANNQLFWAKRAGAKSWQFPQGGMLQGETLEQTLYRELGEEVGLNEADVTVLAKSGRWHHYDIPPAFQRPDRTPCLGQRQRWFLLRFDKDNSLIDLNASPIPELCQWRWVDYWVPLSECVAFKSTIYREVLTEFSDILGIKAKS